MQDPTEAAPDNAEGPQAFYLRTVTGSTGSNTIVLQNENGPCALVAIANTLVLEDSPTAAFIREAGAGNSRIDEDALKAHLGEIAGSRTNDSELFAALARFLPKLTQGLDVNPKFDGSFDDTPEVHVFASFGIPIVHGWVLGEIERQEFGLTDKELSHISYEQFCAIQFSETPNEKLGAFVQQYQSQLTTSGFMQLLDTVPEGQFAVLFWNNHFSTVLNHAGQLLILATDLGYQNKPEIVWEVLEPSGAGQFLNGDFSPSDQQLNRDAELAKHLAQEENGRLPAPPAPAGDTSKRYASTHRGARTSAPVDSALSQKPTSSKKTAPKSASMDRRRSSLANAAQTSKSAGPDKKKKQGDRCIAM